MQKRETIYVSTALDGQQCGGCEKDAELEIQASGLQKAHSVPGQTSPTGLEVDRRTTTRVIETYVLCHDCAIAYLDARCLPSRSALC